ncbi:O-linked N-acetylglucosamine transferase, SPINDLY family protein [Leptolyngbya sp. 'hensonii']|uniref:O-linked N-acetylglucosamine transferase, SPINDLY family protein n=1 Tax=Leptolyngbya sp. 'hensonii' TaxID=1922337 RepID=UPI00094FD2FF|nr:O-linked N-acetylglucosamine transferase, SPINDLY family protein [Leptolyngbya sp. 'hensonii']OLP18346.1 O-linked N-acetylglucosamine transferase, SPINDLY family protein [Leptolyngbya sp. 'hensonii']
MSLGSELTIPVDLQVQAYQYLLEAEYGQAIQVYEQAIEDEPNCTLNYWYLGMALLLKGQEAEAQATWLMALAEADADQEEIWTQELLQVVQLEAERQECLEKYAIAWALRRHIQEICPQNLNNLLRIIQLTQYPQANLDEESALTDAITLMGDHPPLEVSPQLLLETVITGLTQSNAPDRAIDLFEAAIPYIEDEQHWLSHLVHISNLVCYAQMRAPHACRIAELCLKIRPNDLAVMGRLSAFYQKASRYEEGIEVARQYCALASSIPTQVFGSYLLLRGLMTAGGFWDEVQQALMEHERLLRVLIEVPPDDLNPPTAACMFTSTFFLPYLVDDLAHNRFFHNQVSTLSQRALQYYFQERVEKFKQRHRTLARTAPPNKILKVGYLSTCLRQHSVGWLARWLFQHHNSEQFQVYTYLINQPEIDVFTQRWFVDPAFQTRQLGIDSCAIADQVFADEIDILVDLESLTLDTTCEVMSLKPAPVQVTWLGWDAAGIPEIDYYIADPYVLPESAQEHYLEEIWRLPQTYIAVDGFEVGVPDISREQFGIPNEAVIYLSAQQGPKRNPQTSRLQMQIIKAVPGSYFLIKSLADQEAVKKAFLQLAEEEGVDRDRLRFLPATPSEVTHRANLGIADVVLDTYPYNGATTTLETLWMGIPLVTRAGEHFSSRNSYTMMMNVGVTEGIAWSSEEYVDWGIRLGKDEALRQKISWQLRKSRQTSPLWNGRKFTQDMEQAYQQMWQRFIFPQPSVSDRKCDPSE